jgi:hypothetical protein
MEREGNERWKDGLDEETLSIVHELMVSDDGDDDTKARAALLPGSGLAIGVPPDGAAESVGAAPAD